MVPNQIQQASAWRCRIDLKSLLVFGSVARKFCHSPVDSEELVASFLVMLRFIMVGHCTQRQLCLKEVHFEWLGPWVSSRMERACCGKPAPRKRMLCPTNRGFMTLARELWWIIQWFRCCRQLTELKKGRGGVW